MISRNHAVFFPTLRLRNSLCGRFGHFCPIRPGLAAQRALQGRVGELGAGASGPTTIAPCGRWSRTYFPREGCVFPQMTEGRTQSSAGKRSPRSRSTSSIPRCAHEPGTERELPWIDTGIRSSKGEGHARTDGNECAGRHRDAARRLERQALGPTTQARPRHRGPKAPMHTKPQASRN